MRDGAPVHRKHTTTLWLLYRHLYYIRGAPVSAVAFDKRRFFLLVFFPFFLPVFLSRAEKASSFLANHCRWIQGSSARNLETSHRIASRRSTLEPLNGELTRGDPSGCPFYRDANSWGLTCRRGERHIAPCRLTSAFTVIAIGNNIALQSWRRYSLSLHYLQSSIEHFSSPIISFNHSLSKLYFYLMIMERIYYVVKNCMRPYSFIIWC